MAGKTASGTQFAVGLGELRSAQGPGSVSVAFEVEGRLEFLSIGSPSYVIYTGRFCAPVCRYPIHGQELDCVPFGPSLISLFGLLELTMLTSIHLVLTMSSDASAPPD